MSGITAAHLLSNILNRVPTSITVELRARSSSSSSSWQSQPDFANHPTSWMYPQSSCEYVPLSAKNVQRHALLSSLVEEITVLDKLRGQRLVESSQSSYSTRTTTASFASDDDPVFYEDDRDKYLDLRVKGEVSEQRAMVNAPVPVSIPLHHPKPRRHHNIEIMHSLAMDFGEEIAYGESEVEIPRTPAMDPVPLPPVTPSPLDVAEDDIPDWKSEVTFLEYPDELEGLEEVEAFESGLEWSQIRQWANSILMNFGD